MEACAMPASVPAVLAAWMQPFTVYFTTAVWRHVLVLVAGALLAPGRRTVTAALRIMGLDQAPGFAVYHRVLSLGRWSSRSVAHRLLLLLVAAFVPTGPVVVGLDDTIERRWGAKIKARGIYRDPVRSKQACTARPTDAAGCTLVISRRASNSSVGQSEEVCLAAATLSKPAACAGSA
jgi:DDE superfamily endonuclease